MYCTKCGEVMLEEGKVCAKCGGSFDNGGASSQSVAGGKRQFNGVYRKTRAMNMVGAIGTAVEAGAMILYTAPLVAIPELVFIIVLYIVLVATAVTTFFALSSGASRVLQKTAFVLNSGLITLWAVSMFGRSVTPSYSIVLGAALFLVVPEFINLRALRALLKQA